MAELLSPSANRRRWSQSPCDEQRRAQSGFLGPFAMFIRVPVVATGESSSTRWYG